MAKKFFSLLIASFVFANFITDNIIVNAATAVKRTKGKSKQNVAANGGTESLKSANLTTEEEIVALQKLIDEVGQGSDMDLGEDDEDADYESSNSKKQKNKRDRRRTRRRNKQRARRRTAYQELDNVENFQEREISNVGGNATKELIDTTISQVPEESEVAKTSEKSNTSSVNRRIGNRRRQNRNQENRYTVRRMPGNGIDSVENLQERESINVGQNATAELIDTTISQVPEESEVATTSEKSNTSSDNRRIGNRIRQNRNQENEDTAKRIAGNGERQRGRNGNGRRGVKRTGANKDSNSRRPSGRAGARNTPNKFKFNGSRLPINKGGRSANRNALNSRNGRNRF